MTTDDIIFVGAGIAGLTLAHRLSDANRDVRVLEARPRVGGRTIAVEHGGAAFDLGASWIWESEQAVIGLVKELGLSTYESHRGGIDLFETPEALQRIRLPGSSVAEYRIDGGTAAIARRLGEHVGESIEFSRPVRELALDGDAIRVAMDDETLRARTVVWAAPPALLRDVIAPITSDEERLRAVAHTPVWMGDIAKVVAHYETPFWLEQGLSGRAFSRVGPMMEVHDLSGRDRTSAAALFGFVPQQLAVGDWQAEVHAQLERLFGPQARSPKALEIKVWWDEAETTPAHYEPVQQLMGHPILREPLLDGRLHLGSTETAQVSAGHIDGAVRRAESLAHVLMS